MQSADLMELTIEVLRYNLLSGLECFVLVNTKQTVQGYLSKYKQTTNYCTAVYSPTLRVNQGV